MWQLLACELVPSIPGCQRVLCIAGLSLRQQSALLDRRQARLLQLGCRVRPELIKPMVVVDLPGERKNHRVLLLGGLWVDGGAGGSHWIYLLVRYPCTRGPLSMPAPALLHHHGCGLLTVSRTRDYVGTQPRCWVFRQSACVMGRREGIEPS